MADQRRLTSLLEAEDFSAHDFSVDVFYSPGFYSAKPSGVKKEVSAITPLLISV